MSYTTGERKKNHVKPQLLRTFFASILKAKPTQFTRIAQPKYRIFFLQIMVLKYYSKKGTLNSKRKHTFIFHDSSFKF